MCGRDFWWVLVTSPEILVFLFFMITDPKTTPKGRLARIVTAQGSDSLATLLIAPMRTEFAAKVALLGSLTIVCAARPALEWLLPAAGSRDDRISAWAASVAARGRAGFARVGAVGFVGVAGFAGLVVLAGIPARPGSAAAALRDTGRIPQVSILHSSGVSSQLDRKTSLVIAHSLVADLRSRARALRLRNAKLVGSGLCCNALTEVQKSVAGAKGGPITVRTYRLEHMAVKLRPAQGQGELIVVARVSGQAQDTVYEGAPPKIVQRNASAPFTGTFQLDLSGSGYEIISLTGAKVSAPKPSTPSNLLVAKSFDGVTCTTSPRRSD